MSNRSRIVADLKTQLEAAPWLKWGLAAIAVLAVLFCWQALAEARSSVQQEAIREEAKLRRIRALQGQDVWIARRKEAADLHASLLAEIPAAATPGLAQAALQSWLRERAASASNGKDIRVSVDEAVAVENHPGLLRVRASFNGRMPARQALHIIRQIEGATDLVLLETVDIRSDVNETVTLTMNAYYRTSAGDAE